MTTKLVQVHFNHPVRSFVTLKSVRCWLVIKGEGARGRRCCGWYWRRGVFIRHRVTTGGRCPLSQNSGQPAMSRCRAPAARWQRVGAGGLKGESPGGGSSTLRSRSQGGAHAPVTLCISCTTPEPRLARVISERGRKQTGRRQHRGARLLQQRCAKTGHRPDRSRQRRSR